MDDQTNSSHTLSQLSKSENSIGLNHRPLVFKSESAPLGWTDPEECLGVNKDVPWIPEAEILLSPEVAITPSPEASRLGTPASQSIGVLDGGVRSSNVTVELPLSTLTEPASHFVEGFIPPAPEEREWRAVATLLDLVPTDPRVSEDDFVEFELDNFSIYIDTVLFPNELRPLHHLSSLRATRMYFDGILRCGDVQFFLRKVPFQKLPVGNYGESNHSVGDQIWILSDLNEKKGREIYYKLRSPAPEYRRFHEPYLWIADLAKHVIDYCEYCRRQSRRVLVQDFKLLFSNWSMRQHQRSDVFRRWHDSNRGTDFRGAVVANIEYIWKEAHGLDPEITSWHPIWRETKTLDHYVPNLAPRTSHGVLRTTVTPYVYDLFSHMVFGQLLESTEVCSAADARRTQFTQDIGFRYASFRSSKRAGNIKKGDVISTKPDDDADTNTEWKRAISKHYQGEYVWFGLVQKVHNTPSGLRLFDVLWLYQPVDTPCSVMKYPWENELFLSDNCTCHHRTTKVREDQILAVHEVEFFGTPSTSAEYFVRQTYVASDCRWASLREEHFDCGDEGVFSQENEIQYRVGDTVLVQTETLQLEAFIIERFFSENKKQFVGLRRLLRRKDVDINARSAPPNELVYSHQLAEIAAKRIDRRCLVRAFRVDEEILPPYNRNGTGDAFYITHQELDVDGVAEFHPLELAHLQQLFRQGFDPRQNHEVRKLHGLDLFCGGGNFGRGIEESGVVEMHWANDIWNGAIHTYMANSNPGCTPFLGSIDNLLHLALEGDQKVPSPGDVHFISAGSPCPGFSSLTIDRTTEAQRKNQSLVASFASFVDLYRPLYGLLENVPKMVNSDGFRDSCVFSQLVCALIGLGYQVQVMFLDAWAFGSAQNRTRVFLAFTAAGLPTPKAPKPSHSHPDNVYLHKLGVMSCGRPFDSRKRVPTSFKFTTFRDAVGDLPNIQDAKADYCVGYPDHRLSMGYTPLIRKQIQQIPTRPYGMNFSKAWYGGIMTASERSLYPGDSKTRAQKFSKGWGRINPTKLVGTIATKCMPTDARIGQANHWEQSRPMTILEARRAQGYLDSDVIVGTPSDQYKVVGNSVCRQVAQVLGLAIREAWLGTLFEERAENTAEFACCPDVTIQSVEVEEIEVAVGVQSQRHTGIDVASDAESECPLTIFTPLSIEDLTPVTNDSVEPGDAGAHRKRSLPLYVEALSKRRRQSVSVNSS